MKLREKVPDIIASGSEDTRPTSETESAEPELFSILILITEAACLSNTDGVSAPKDWATPKRGVFIWPASSGRICRPDEMLTTAFDFPSVTVKSSW